MKIITLLTSVALFAATPAFAQDHGDHGDHHDHKTHDHESHDHGDHKDHEMKDDAMTKETAAPAAAVEGRTAIVNVNGMVCDFCARSLTKVLKKKDAVEDVAISLEDKTVTIIFAEGKSMTDEEIEKAVKSAGYNLASIERA